VNHVLIQLEALLVPGLLLKWGREGKEALVTYEHEGRVETSWVGFDRVVPVPDGEH
jgi:hypothetical protein